MHMKKITDKLKNSFKQKRTDFIALSTKDKSLLVLFYTLFILGILTLVIYNSLTFTYNMSTNDLYKVGHRAPLDFEISKDFEYFDKELTETRKKEAYDKVEPIFVYRNEKSQEMNAELRQFVDFIQPLVLENLANDVYKSRVLRRLNSRQIDIIPESDILYLNTLNSRQLDDFFQIIEASVSTLSYIPLISDDKVLQRFSTSNVSVYKRSDGNIERTFIDMSKYSSGSNIDSEINKFVAGLKNLRFSQDSVFNYTKAFLVANTFFSDDETKKMRDVAMSEVVDEKRFFPADTVIINENEIVSKDDKNIITAYNKFLVGQANFTNVLGLIFAVILIVLSLKLVFRPNFLRKTFTISDKLILLLSAYLIMLPSLIIHHFGISAIWMQPVYFIPFLISVLLVAILINSLTSIFFIILIAIINLIFLTVNTTFLVYMIYVGVVSAVLANKVESPQQLFKAMLKILLTALSYVIIIGMFESISFVKIIILSSIVALNIFVSVLITMGFIHLFELLFNLATPFRLTELSNTSLPIFKHMQSVAPGTFSHSSTVALLAEAACREIGANGLLAKVGSLYHDIGKLDQAEYFVENQKTSNKHDELLPGLSITVIKAHVNKGIEKAKTLKLPREVIDIIEQHHGTGVILYFYIRALTGLDKDKNTILKDDYRYKTPLPKTKEAAVVMLADSVEAANRTLKNPTTAQLDKFFWKIMKEKFDSKQLSEAPLTFQELETVKNVFVNVLVGYDHARVEYPKEKANE